MILIFAFIATAIVAACNGQFQTADGQRWTVAPLQLEPVGKLAPVGPVPTVAAPAATAVPGAPTATPAPAKPVNTPIPVPERPASGTPAAVLTPAGSHPFTPPKVLPPVIDGKVISADVNHWARIILKNDGSVVQDVIAAEETGARPPYEMLFTLPNPIPGGNARVFRGVEVTILKVSDGSLHKAGAVVAKTANGTPITLEPGDYKLVAPSGNNNSFSLEHPKAITKTPKSDEPYIVSESTDWTRVALQPDGRFYMDEWYKGSPGFETYFRTPKVMAQKLRVYQGNNCTLAEVTRDGTGKVTDLKILDGKHVQTKQAMKTSNAENVVVELKPDTEYYAKGGAGNGGFALEMPKGDVIADFGKG